MMMMMMLVFLIALNARFKIRCLRLLQKVTTLTSKKRDTFSDLTVGFQVPNQTLSTNRLSVCCDQM